MNTQPTPTTLMELDSLSMIAAKGEALTNTMMLALNSTESAISNEVMELALYDIFDKFKALKEGIDNVTI